MSTIATLFAGGGGVEVGAMAAGLSPLWSVEYDAEIAAVHQDNLPGQMIVAPVQCVDPYTLERPDVLHASPPCPNFSVAKAGAEETPEDLAMADAVCRFLRVLTPSVFTLENVMGYRQSCSYQRILCTLDVLGYWTHSDVINAADYGVPQTRKRLILRAVRDGFPTPLPPKQRWVGWYEAIEDLIPTLPESKFADWQLQRLPEELTTMLFNGMDMRSTGRQMMGRLAEEPSATVTADDGRRPSSFPAALLIEGDAAGERCPTICEPEQPAFTLKTASGGRVHRAFLVDGKPANYQGDLQITDGENPVVTVTASQEKHPFRAFLHGNGTRSMPVPDVEPADAITGNSNQTGVRAWLNQGRVVSMTPRALARFQSFPDTYLLPDNKTLACRIIGNAVPPKLYEAIIGGLV